MLHRGEPPRGPRRGCPHRLRRRQRGGQGVGSVGQALRAQPRRAASQGIPHQGLDFPAEIAPITGTESFSIKPATGGLETVHGLPHLHSAAIRSGRPHGDELARQPAARLSQQHSPTEARAARSGALPARHTRALPLPGRLWGRGRSAGQGVPRGKGAARTAAACCRLPCGAAASCAAQAPPLPVTRLRLQAVWAREHPAAEFLRPPRCPRLAPSAGSQPASPLGARRLAVQPVDGPGAVPCPQAHGHITPIITVAAVPKAELCHSPCDWAVNVVPVAMSAVPWLCHTRGSHHHAVPIVPGAVPCPLSP